MKNSTPSSFATTGLSEYILLSYPHASEPNPQAQGPELALGYFQAKEMLEPTLIRWIRNICALHQGFDLHLSSSNNASVLEESKDLLQLAARLHVLDEFLKDNGCPGFHSNPSPSLIFAGAADSTTSSWFFDRLHLLKKTGASEDALLLNTFVLTAPTFTN